MNATFVINLSAEAPVFNITLGDGVSFSVTSGAQAQPLHHKESHSTSGADRIRPEDIGAQALFSSASVSFTDSSPTSVTLTAARAVNYLVANLNPAARTIVLPTTGHQVGDIVVIRTGTMASNATVLVNIQQSGFQSTSATLTKTNQAVRFVATGTSQSNWSIEPVLLHSHTASEITDFTAAVTAIVNAIRPL